MLAMSFQAGERTALIEMNIIYMCVLFIYIYIIYLFIYLKTH